MLRRNTIPGTPMLGGYRAVNPLLYMYLRAWDVALVPAGLLRRGIGCDTVALEHPPRRVLVANCAHLGDVVLATSVLPVLKTVFPGVSIGFLCGGWSREILERHPLVDRVHTVDNWKLNRSDERTARKVLRYVRTRRQAIAEIHKAQYDAAVDLYYFYPNASDILWASGIPVRIGFASGGFGGLYTHRVPYRYEAGRHVTEYYADLLRYLGAGNEQLVNMRPTLGGVGCASWPQLKIEPGAQWHGSQDYVVIHMGTGNRAKEWPVARWSNLVRRLHAAGYQLVFTGRGARERRLVELVSGGVSRCINLCDRLEIGEFVAAVEQARLVVGGDSVAAHVAAAVGTATVVIATGIDFEAWRPMRANARTLMHPVRCAPCFVGCRGMECVREVEVNAVHQAIEEALKQTGPAQMVTA